MNFLKKIFGQSKQLKDNKYTDINSSKDFWNWFVTNEKKFFAVIKNQGNIEKDFFNLMTPQLKKIHAGIYFLAGMSDDDTAELILTPDGNLKNIVFTEELIKDAPRLTSWKFTALKPATLIDSASIHMADFKFGSENIHFYSNEHDTYPDEIDITLIYDDYDEANKDLIANGIYIFLDNYLGELQSVTMIDNVQIKPPQDADKELVPISKLQDFLIWREKEFVEKYEANYHDSENDKFTLYEAELESGLPLLATMNTTLLEWDDKPSHPYILRIYINYKGNENGLPEQHSFDLMNEFEDILIENLPDKQGYLNVGRQTGDGLKEIYFASKEFRNCSKIVANIIAVYNDKLDVNYEIYKDKYWQTFERFRMKNN